MAWSEIANLTAPPGTTDHGAQGGLGDDDHTQYHTDARGDARYQLLDAAAGGALTGTYPDPTLAVVPHAPVALSDVSTVATDAALGTLFRVTIAGNRTLGAPSNPADGQFVIWEVTASGADRTLTLATGAGGFVFGSDITALTPVIAAKTDFIRAAYNSTANRWRIVAYVKGY